MDIPIDFMFFNDGEYRETYVSKLRELMASHNITHVVYGDLYLMEHRTWLEDVCKEIGLTPLFPMWIEPSQAIDLYNEFIGLWFKAVIVSGNKPVIGKELIGSVLDNAFGEKANGSFCPMGENGEFHTLVIDGPLFSKPLSITKSNITEDEKAYTLNIEAIEILN